MLACPCAMLRRSALDLIRPPFVLMCCLCCCRFAWVLWRVWVCSHDLLDAQCHLVGSDEAKQEELRLLAQHRQHHSVCCHHVPCGYRINLLHCSRLQELQILSVRQKLTIGYDDMLRCCNSFDCNGCVCQGGYCSGTAVHLIFDLLAAFG